MSITRKDLLMTTTASPRRRVNTVLMNKFQTALDSNDPVEWRMVAFHRSATPTVLHDLFLRTRDHGLKTNNMSVVWPLLKHKNVSIETLTAWVQAVAFEGEGFAYWAPKLPNLQGTLFNTMLTAAPHNQRAWLLHGLLGHPNFPAHVFDLYIHDRYHAAVIAGNPNCPDNLQLQLARSPWARVRAALVENPSLSREALTLLQEDRNSTVMAALLKNGHGTPEILEIAATHPSSFVRRYAASHVTDPDLLTEYAMDPSPYVSRRATNNPACPDEGRVGAALMGRRTG